MISEEQEHEPVFQGDKNLWKIEARKHPKFAKFQTAIERKVAADRSDIGDGNLYALDKYGNIIGYWAEFHQAGRLDHPHGPMLEPNYWKESYMSITETLEGNSSGQQEHEVLVKKDGIVTQVKIKANSRSEAKRLAKEAGYKLPFKARLDQSKVVKESFRDFLDRPVMPDVAHVTEDKHDDDLAAFKAEHSKHPNFHKFEVSKSSGRHWDYSKDKRNGEIEHVTHRAVDKDGKLIASTTTSTWKHHFNEGYKQKASEKKGYGHREDRKKEANAVRRAEDKTVAVASLDWETNHAALKKDGKICPTCDAPYSTHFHGRKDDCPLAEAMTFTGDARKGLINRGEEAKQKLAQKIENEPSVADRLKKAIRSQKDPNKVNDLIALLAQIKR